MSTDIKDIILISKLHPSKLYNDLYKIRYFYLYRSVGTVTGLYYKDSLLSNSA